MIEIAFPGQARRKKFQWLSHAEYLDGEGDSPGAAARVAETISFGVEEGIRAAAIAVLAGQRGRNLQCRITRAPVYGRQLLRSRNSHLSLRLQHTLGSNAKVEIVL